MYYEMWQEMKSFTFFPPDHSNNEITLVININPQCCHVGCFAQKLKYSMSYSMQYYIVHGLHSFHVNWQHNLFSILYRFTYTIENLLRKIFIIEAALMTKSRNIVFVVVLKLRQWNDGKTTPSDRKHQERKTK